MSVLLNDAANEYLYDGSAVLTAVPLTMVCRFYIDDDTVNNGLISICDFSSNFNYFMLATIRSGTASHPSEIWGYTVGGSSAKAYSGNQYSQDTWHHAAFVSSAVNSRYAYLDGVPGAQDTVSITPSGLDITGIGVLLRDAVTMYASGKIAEVGIWNVALTTAEIEILSKGYCPLLVRPQNLVAYWPLIREVSAGVYRDIIGGRNTGEVGGSDTADHPRVIFPQGQQISSVAPIATLILPLAMHHYRNMRLT